MEVIIVENADQVGQVAADKVIENLEGIATPVLGLATGSSPLSLYAELSRRSTEGIIDFSHGLGFALDEYVGIDPAHPESYRNVIHRTVVEPLGMDPDRVRVPNGFADDLEAAADEYDEAIETAGGVDVQILGIGSNGHIGFNEPFSSFSSRTHVEILTAQTREDNARFFNSIDEVPTHCMTQGLGTIMDSRVAVLVATGEHKADAIAAMVEGPVANVMPASILQFHPNCIVIVDEAAASKLEYAAQFKAQHALKQQLTGKA
ncbi:glucosamine-6-phosphate deaminase [Tessaracoccus sp. Y36]|uniref:glucosamine-6-phosphate deaminase n=1 Tax=Tessaracoccus sp. ZS01 TaxID=1906324 RepID=UPI00096FB31D|nr:glucosamine-6-phosphate deaminase [Tessaracoccus sp. ZS01]MCG6568615.1 glucosamine-6-phosphate deaminase [Tessaracoccus sp. ZS01]OMG52216.1 glucosamine-6-phosphate deaminase [Tessaracoccus sp. ZS01]